MNAEYVSKLIAENIDKEVLVNILSGRIRQQQAEIENLKAGLLSHHDIYPVKELTDEEIADFLYAYCLDMGNVYEASEEQFIKCVRAIMKRAQGK